MGLILAGIDEAGYGPLLGPMCVAMAALRIDGVAATGDRPDLWSLLAPAVSREPKPRSTKTAAPPIAVGDSKKLKKANSNVTVHPLTYLERGVLSFAAPLVTTPIATDEGLLSLLGAARDGHECYGGDPIALPLAWSAAELSISASMVSGALGSADARVEMLRCRWIAEPEFNRIARETGSKGEVTIAALGEHLRALWLGCVGRGDEVVLVCDRLGGRQQYGETLAALMRTIEPGGHVRAKVQTPECSAYTIEGDRGTLHVGFEVESESRHFAVALASMTAKLVRELAMMRFNRYWGARAAAHSPVIELKPTAGYRNDGWRWLRDAGGLLSATDRAMLERLA